MDQPRRDAYWLLRRADQAAVGAIALVGLVAMAGYWISQGGARGRLIEIERAPLRSARFTVDVNTAGWPELAQMPDVGETLARRIVASRQAGGPFADHEDLRRVRGIGAKTLERMRPYLRPLAGVSDVAAQPRSRRPSAGGS